MHAASIEKENRPPAPCRQARRLLAAAVAVTCLIVLAMGAHWIGLSFQKRGNAQRWMRALSLSAPVLGPAGSPLRHPETVHPGIELRHTVGVEVLP